MSKQETIDNFIAEQQAHNLAMSTALTDLAGDLVDLAKQIADLKSDDFPAETQQALTDLGVAGQTLADKATALAAVNPPNTP